MKMIKKITAVTAALAAAASMSAVAFAENDFTATYNKEADTVSVTNLTATFSDQITVVIVPDGAESINSENIYYIDQDSVANKDALLKDMGVLTGSMVEGKTYEVRIGCTEGAIYTAKFTIEADTPSITYGDVDGIAGISVNDATAIAKYIAGMIDFTAELKKAADVDGIAGISVNDATAIAKYIAGMVPSLPVQ